MPLGVPEDLRAERVGDLRVDLGVLDVPVAEMVSHARDAAARVEEMHGDRVTEAVDRATLDAGGLGVLLEKILDLALLQRSLPAMNR